MDTQKIIDVPLETLTTAFEEGDDKKAFSWVQELLFLGSQVRLRKHGDEYLAEISSPTSEVYYVAVDTNWVQALVLCTKAVQKEMQRELFRD